MKQQLVVLRMWILSLMLILSSSISYSMINEGIIISFNEGHWNVAHKERSLYFPFTAYHDANTVTIYNDKPVCDLTIMVTDTESGAEVYSVEVSAESSSYIVLPVSDLGSGNYCLTISNPEAGYVYGYFNL